MDGLDPLRREIDDIDRELVRLFESRMVKVKEIGNVKRKQGLPILDASREEEVLKRAKTYLKDKDLAEDLEQFFSKLMEISKEVQERDRG